VDADSPQHTGERYLLSDYSQGSAGSSPSDETNIAGNIYLCRATLITGEGKVDGLYPSYIVANSHAPFTENAKIMVSKKERAILLDR